MHDRVYPKASELSPKFSRKVGPAGKEGLVGPIGKEGKAGPPAPNVLLSENEQKALKAILPYINYLASGVGGKPTIQFSGVNVQVLSGAGAPQRSKVNGLGNLVIGNDEESDHGEWDGELVPAGKQTGSDNLIVGDEQSYSSYGSVIAGYKNVASAPATDVFGLENGASAEGASVTGGEKNQATGFTSSVGGGYGNTATKLQSAVSGGAHNVASNNSASVSGGLDNTAEGVESSVSGGTGNNAQSLAASVSGGHGNQAEGEDSAISGGANNATGKTTFSNGVDNWIAGGEGNRASGRNGSLVGGHDNLLYTGEDDVISGGTNNLVELENEIIQGVFIEGGHYDSIFGGNKVTQHMNNETSP